jgi:predicted  nucleic acid-binding Zn-ribbon protein
VSERAVDEHGAGSGATFRELSLLVARLGDELAGFRRRALQAEAELRQLRDDTRERTPPEEDPRPRLEELERENAALRSRLEAATVRTRQMLERVRFLRQQVSG